MRGVISVDISNWHADGNTVKKPAMYCTAEEIKTEVWEELKLSHTMDDKQLTDEVLHCWFLDPDIQREKWLEALPLRDRPMSPVWSRWMRTQSRSSWHMSTHGGFDHRPSRRSRT